MTRENGRLPFLLYTKTFGLDSRSYVYNFPPPAPPRKLQAVITRKTKKKESSLSLFLSLCGSAPPRIAGVLLVLLLVRRVFLPLSLSELLQVHLEGLHVVLEAEGGHRPQQVLPIDGFPLLPLALVAGLTRDEGDELRDALLHGLLRVLGYLGVVRKRFLHNSRDIRDGQIPVLLSYVPHRHKLALSDLWALLALSRHLHQPRENQETHKSRLHSVVLCVVCVRQGHLGYNLLTTR
mmetsp:Transcript_6719/g.24225  ORF Transcript_6719/g.24225 Transcript_6719/m.24225 type:complete len:236 (-) Transcript_6719:121-828(-)